MAKNNDDSKMNPPYVAFGTFKRFIETLSKTAVPGRIDRSVLPKMSGVTQSQLTSALKFLHLVGPTGATRQPLHDLVKAYGSEEWADTLGTVISDAYMLIVKGLNLDSGTANELRDAFKGRGKVDGQLLMKAVRFYLKAMAEANLEISPHFKAPSLPTTTKKKKKKTKPNGQWKSPTNDYTPDPDDEDDFTPLEGTIRFPIYFRGKPTGAIIVPADLAVTDCSSISAMLTPIKAYAEQCEAEKAGQE